MERYWSDTLRKYVTIPEGENRMKEVQYSQKIDKVIYSEHTRDFAKEDWIKLANAAFDQAGLSWTVKPIDIPSNRDLGYNCE